MTIITRLTFRNKAAIWKIGKRLSNIHFALKTNGKSLTTHVELNFLRDLSKNTSRRRIVENRGRGTQTGSDEKAGR